MNTPETASSSQTVIGLLHQLTTQLSTLLRQELTLARTELYQATMRFLRSAGAVGGGIALLYTAFLLLLVAAVAGLTAVMPLWLAALSLGVLIGLLGWGLIHGGRTTLKGSHLAPTRLPQSLRRDKDVLLRRAHS